MARFRKSKSGALSARDGRASAGAVRSDDDYQGPSTSREVVENGGGELRAFRSRSVSRHALKATPPNARRSEAHAFVTLQQAVSDGGAQSALPLSRWLCN